MTRSSVLLPLDSAKIKTLAVIGPNGDKMRIGSYAGIPPYYVTILDGIKHRVGPVTRVVFVSDLASCWWH